MALTEETALAMGIAHGQALSERVNVKDVPPRLAAALVGEFLAQVLGIRSCVTAGSAERAEIEVDHCPIYEAAEALGMEHATIEAVCRAGAIPYMDAIVKQFNPELAYELRQFRPAADTTCIEMISVDRR